MPEHKIQSTNAAAGVKRRNGGLKELPNAPPDEEFDNFDSSPIVPGSKRLIVDLYVTPHIL
jgi:phosphopantothenate-cysteine ligase